MSKSLFPVFRSIDDITDAERIMEFCEERKITSASDFEKLRPENIHSYGTVSRPPLGMELYRKLEQAFTTNGITLLPTLQIPISQLYETCPKTEVTRELQIYAKFRRLESIEDLAQLDASDLAFDQVTAESVDYITATLATKFKATLGTAEQDSHPAVSKKMNLTGYEVIRNADHFVVNGLRVDFQKRKKSLSPDVVENIYRLHSAGKDPEQILTELDGVVKMVRTIENHLERAKVYSAGTPE